MKDPNFQKAIAEKLAELHSYVPVGPRPGQLGVEPPVRTPAVFATIEKWFIEVENIRFSGSNAFVKNEALRKLSINNIRNTVSMCFH